MDKQQHTPELLACRIAELEDRIKALEHEDVSDICHDFHNHRFCDSCNDCGDLLVVVHSSYFDKLKNPSGDGGKNEN